MTCAAYREHTALTQTFDAKQNVCNVIIIVADVDANN